MHIATAALESQSTLCVHCSGSLHRRIGWGRGSHAPLRHAPYASRPNAYAHASVKEEEEDLTVLWARLLCLLSSFLGNNKKKVHKKNKKKVSSRSGSRPCECDTSCVLLPGPLADALPISRRQMAGLLKQLCRPQFTIARSASYNLAPARRRPVQAKEATAPSLRWVFPLPVAGRPACIPHFVPAPFRSRKNLEHSKISEFPREHKSSELNFRVDKFCMLLSMLL